VVYEKGESFDERKPWWHFRIDGLESMLDDISRKILSNMYPKIHVILLIVISGNV